MQTSGNKASAGPKKTPKVRLKKTDPKQSQRFIEAAREAGASEDEAVFDENLARLAKPRDDAQPKALPKRGARTK